MKHRGIMIGIVAFFALVVVVLAGTYVAQQRGSSYSSPQSSASAYPTQSSQAASSTQSSMGSGPLYPSQAPQMPSKRLGVPAPSPRPNPTPASGVGHLKAVHSPGMVTDDAHLKPGQCHAQQAADGLPLPDPDCTPGAVDPAVTPANLSTTICKAGWTATVRPPASNTDHWKAIDEKDYNDPAGFMGEYDHLVPLELGGANSTTNLWPEPGAIPNPKDKIENGLKTDVCAGKITLQKAQQEIASDWTKVG